MRSSSSPCTSNWQLDSGALFSYLQLHRSAAMRSMSMIQIPLVCFVVLVTFFTSKAECGGQTVVLGGNSTGWTNVGNINYTQWISSYKLKVGDTLIFSNGDTYNHTLVEVESEAAYDACTSNAATDKHATIPPGKLLEITYLKPFTIGYFICGEPGHCLAGQKVSFGVLDSNGNPASPPITATPSTLDVVSKAAGLYSHTAWVFLAFVAVASYLVGSTF